jgi:LemA protein
MIFIYVVFGLIALVGLYVILTYNSLVSLKQRVSEAWSDIEVQMKRRYNLIPNLVETVRGYMGHERETLESVTRLRNQAMADHGTAEHQAKSENMLTGALRSLFALAEAYPDLKANQNFADLQDDLAEVEDRIQAARRFYNGSVRDLNVKIEQFPSNLVAQAFHFTQATFFELDEADAAARRPVKVEF